MNILKNIQWEVWPTLGLIGASVMMFGLIDANYLTAIIGMVFFTLCLPITTYAQKQQRGRG